MLRTLLTVALTLALATAADAAVVTYGSPAGNTPAGPSATSPYTAVLPSGRIVAPAGTSVVTGMNALGIALTPDGRFAIVTNDDERQGETRSTIDPATYGGFSLAVVDVASMTVVDRYRAVDETFFLGLAAVQDPADATRTLVLASGGASNVVYAFTLDANGRLKPDARHYISTPAPIDPAFGDQGHSFPATIVASTDGRFAYVVNEAGGSVSAIDTRSRTLVGASAPVGFFPLGLAIAGSSLIVANEGLMRYGVVAQPTFAPPFLTPASDPARASSLSFVPLAADGTLAALPPPGSPFVPSLPMDPTPDGARIIGGAHPSAIAVSPDKAFAFVAMTNVDRIATVALGPTPHVVGGTELRLFDRGPYGTQPTALVLSRDGSRLYVTLAGLNAVAVIDARDPAHLHRLGLIPTGWYPTAIALSPDEHALYVANTKGFGHERGFTGDLKTEADSNAVWSTLQKIDLGRVKLVESTRTLLSNTRRTLAKPPVYPPGVRNVVVILEENKSFDSMLGDLGYGPADPSLVMYGESITPNLHALARRYALAGNFFADAEESDAAHQFLTGGIATAYSERTLFDKSGRRPLVNKNEDPEDYPRVGYIFNNLARHGFSYRDYGDLVRVSGYDEGAADDVKTDDPQYRDIDDVTAPTVGLGGRYSLDVPAPAVLAGHVDLKYPGWNLRIRDERRANEFIRDYGAELAAGREPRFTYIWLPADHTGFGRGIPPIPEEVADGDRALGKIVAYLTSIPSWKHTAIVVLPDDAQSTRDHVDEYRSYALWVSPYAKHHVVAMRHTSTVSVLKTIEGIFKLPPLSLGDLLATDLSDMFAPATAKPDFTPYAALPVARQTASVEGTRIAELLARTDQSDADADSVRGARIIGYSRLADRLAQQRGAMLPSIYRAGQATLYARALDALR